MKRLIFFFLLVSYPTILFGQRLKLDDLATREWKEIANPLISPNGKYVSYIIRDEFKDSTSIVVKSTSSGWEKSFKYARNFFWGYLTDDHLYFKGNSDTLWMVALEKNEETLTNVSDFKVSEDGRLFVAMKADTLIVQRGNTTRHYSRSLNFGFTPVQNKLLVVSNSVISGERRKVIKCINVTDNSEDLIWSASNIGNITYSENKSLIAFDSDDSTTNKKQIIVCDLFNMKVRSFDCPSNSKLRDIIAFNRSNNILVLRYSSESKDPSRQDNGIGLKIWRYTDDIVPLSNVNVSSGNDNLYTLTLDDGKFSKISEKHDQWEYLPSCQNWGDRVLLSQTCGDCYVQEQLWWPACKRKWFIVDLRTGKRVRIAVFDKMNVLNRYIYSPDLKYVVFYDESAESYFSYSIFADKLVELAGAEEKRIIKEQPGLVKGYLKTGNRGIAGWNITSCDVYIYDETDIWKFDLNGRRSPVNVTNGYGRKNHTMFSFLFTEEQDSFSNDECFLVGLNTETKVNSFFKVNLHHAQNPAILGGGQYIFYLPHKSVGSFGGMRPVKAKFKDLYVVRRESSKEFPNYYLTHDFRKFLAISNLQPQSKYRWFTSELHTWRNNDGRKLQGVLYKPDDFDSSKRYPVIFNIYQQLSNSLNAYLRPEYITDGCTINVPFLINRGYLVFKPDIYYKADEAGESALSCVNSAVNHLANVPGVDTSRLGLQGCSWGGFETNYIVSHCNLFKAACSASGVSDIMGFASIKYDPIYTSFYYSQHRLKSMIWEDYKPVVNNSPLFKANGINTPLLIFHTTVDDAVPFNQSVQLFLILRKLRKQSWLLEYGGTANHGVFDMRQRVDFSNRLDDFFDHYLKDKPISGWMLSSANSEE